MSKSTKAILGCAILIMPMAAQAELVLPEGCGHARGQRGGTIAFERAHPTSGGEHGGFWGGWKGLADGCVAYDTGYGYYPGTGSWLRH